MGLDLIGALIGELEAHPERAAEVAALLRPHLAHEPEVDRRLLSVLEAAELIGMSEKTIRRSIDAGELPAHRIGRAVRIAPEALTEFATAAPAARGRRRPRRSARRPDPGGGAVAEAFRALDNVC